MPTTLIVLAAILATSIITWLFCKARFTQHTVTRDEHASLQLQYSQLQASEAILRGLLADVQQSRDGAETRLQSSISRIEELGTRAASLETRGQSLLETIDRLTIQLSASHEQLGIAQNNLSETRSSNVRLHALVEAREVQLAEQKAFIENG